MPTAQINLIKGDKVDSLTDYRDALPVNMYAVQKDILGAKGYMQQWPGLTSYASHAGADRGALFNERQDKHFRVIGTSFVEVSKTGTVTSYGTIPGTEQVSMPYSFNTQSIIANGRMFLFDGTVLSEVTDSDLGNPIDAVWVDGYYFLTDGEFIYHTDITDETSVDPLKFATAEFMPDKSLGVAKTQDNKVVVFGRYTLEYFVNVATANFAFQRVETRAQKIGIVATHAKCEAGGNFYITGGRKEEGLGVHVVSVGSSQKISTREIDKILSAYEETELSDMRMESCMFDDVWFVMIHLPNETLLFNISIASSFGKEYAWTILKTDTIGDLPYIGINGVFESRKGKWVYGSKTGSGIGFLDNSTPNHFGNQVEWILYSPIVSLERFSINELKLDIIPGFTSSEDATVAISLTYDSGVTYGSEWFQLYGLPLSYNQNFIIRRLGYVTTDVGFKFRGISSSRMAFANFTIDYGY